jgi:hypothetical protein
MSRTRSTRRALLGGALLGPLLVAACGGGDVQRRSERLTGLRAVRLRNFTVLLVDPGPGGADLEWTGHHLRTGDAFRVPYEEVLLRGAEGSSLVTTRGAGNQELVVDGVLYRFDASRQGLRVRPGAPPEIVTLPEGVPDPGRIEPAD